MSEDNGDAPVPPQVEHIAAQLRELVAASQTALAQHDLVRDQLVADVRNAEKALTALQGGTGKAGRPKAQGQSRPVPSKLSDERLSEIEAVVREYAEDHEEFRQVDVRSAYGKLPGGGTLTSGMSAMAFEELRQRNVLRVARVEGNSKFYRLTREQLKT
jgi:hypothetical protein